MLKKYKDFINDYVAIIPARSGSKSIKNKNIKKIAGKPILNYSVETALKANFKKIIVSSDSQYYHSLIKPNPRIIFHKRSKFNSRDNSKDIDFFREIISFIETEYKYKFKYVVHLRPTTPIRKIKFIKDAITLFNSKKNKFSSLRSVSLMSNPSYKTMRVVSGKLCHLYKLDFDMDKLNEPRQFFSKTYLPNGYIDIVKLKNIKNNFLHGVKTMPYIVDDINTDIDSYKDYKIIKKNIEDNVRFK